MKKTILSTLFTMLWVLLAMAQGTPIDYLSADFHKQRRDEFRKLLPRNTVVVLFANAERDRVKDVDYKYHQDPNFYYLTGYNEPSAMLVIFSEPQIDALGKQFDEIMYVREEKTKTGRRMGKQLGVEGVKKQSGIDRVFDEREFENFPIDFASFDIVSFVDFDNDYRDQSINANLFNLINTFKKKANYPSDYNPVRNELYAMISSDDGSKTKDLVQEVERHLNSFPNLREDELLNDFVNAPSNNLRNATKKKMLMIQQSHNLDSKVLPMTMAKLREIKTPEEIKLLKKAVEISAVGQILAMKTMRPNMSENVIRGVHEYVYKEYGANYKGYPAIVGSGTNGCAFHYIRYKRTKEGNDLVHMDLGAEYHGYMADVTRTIPANGRFTPEQKAIYDIVYSAQEAGIKASVVGAPFQAPSRAAYQVVAEGLMKLGITKNEEETKIYFPHGVSHYLGLDVHDLGTYALFKPNTVITVEPAISIPEGSKCDEKWWNIAVYIEDDILITEKGPFNLSEMAPRTTEAIEAMMKLSSPLDDFKLPKLD